MGSGQVQNTIKEKIILKMMLYILDEEGKALTDKEGRAYRFRLFRFKCSEQDRDSWTLALFCFLVGIDHNFEGSAYNGLVTVSKFKSGFYAGKYYPAQFTVEVGTLERAVAIALIWGWPFVRIIRKGV